MTEQLITLAREAKRRNLQVEHLGQGCFKVSSSRIPGLWYDVLITDNGETRRCNCPATTDCTHIAMALLESDFTFYRLYGNRQIDEFYSLLTRVRLGQISHAKQKKYQAIGEQVLARTGYVEREYEPIKILSFDEATRVDEATEKVGRFHA